MLRARGRCAGPPETPGKCLSGHGSGVESERSVGTSGAEDEGGSFPDWGTGGAGGPGGQAIACLGLPFWKMGLATARRTSWKVLGQAAELRGGSQQCGLVQLGDDGGAGRGCGGGDRARGLGRRDTEELRRAGFGHRLEMVERGGGLPRTAPRCLAPIPLTKTRNSVKRKSGFSTDEDGEPSFSALGLSKGCRVCVRPGAGPGSASGCCLHDGDPDLCMRSPGRRCTVRGAWTGQAPRSRRGGEGMCVAGRRMEMRPGALPSGLGA